MNRLKGVVLGVAFMALPAIAQGQTQTITFDDVTACTAGTLLPNGYQGLNWDNFYAVGAYPFCMVPSGYRNGVVSAPNVATNGFGDPAKIWVSSGNTFTFNSVYMTAAWHYGMTVTVQGLLGATQIYSQTFSPSTLNALSTDHPTLEVFNWAAVDEVVFTSSGGALAFNFVPTDPGTEIAFDNLTVSNVTPEPATVLLLGTGLIGIGAVMRRRHRKRIES